MNKAQLLTQAQPHCEKFEDQGLNWALETQYGDALLHIIEKNEYYYMDVEASSVFSLSLVVMALKGKNDKSSEITYKLTQVKEDKKVVLQIDTPLEKYSFFFHLRQVDNVEFLIEELEKLKKRCSDMKEKLPIVGTIKPKLWKEYSLNDIVSVFDYSFMNLKSMPLIFMTVEGRSGYVAIQEATNKSCKLFIHWNQLKTLQPLCEKSIHEADLSWKIAFCVFQGEDPIQIQPVAAHASEIKIEEALCTMEGFEDAVKNKKRPLVMLEDKVLDLTEFFERHPGPAAGLKAHIGDEVGRYFYGAVEFNDKKHPHSQKAKELLPKYTVGIIPNKLTSRMFVGLKKDRLIDSYEFKLEAVDGLTDIHMIIKLFNPELKFKPLLNDITTYSRYFAVTSLSQNITRNYGIFYCIDSEIVKSHIQFTKAVDEKAAYKSKYPDIGAITYDNLTFVVRKRPGGFSNWVTVESAIHTNMIIRGPFVFLK